MKSIKQQYIDLREGNMSQANFMRSIRLSLPQYVTNITSFNDSVKILKNKGILTEADMNMDSSELAMGIKVEMEHTEDMAVAKKIAMDHLAENPKYYSELKVSGIEKPQATSDEPGSPIKNISSDDVMSLDVNLNRANPRDGFTLGFYEGKESAQITPEAIEVALENIWEEGLIDTVTWKTASKALPNFDIDGNTNMVGTSTADDLARELVFVATGNNVPDIVDYDDEEYNKAAEDDFDINMRVDQERENRFNENKSLSEGFDEDGENHSISIENNLEDRYSKGEITQQTLDNALDYVADHDYDLWADRLGAEYVLQQPGVVVNRFNEMVGMRSTPTMVDKKKKINKQAVTEISMGLAAKTLKSFQDKGFTGDQHEEERGEQRKALEKYINPALASEIKKLGFKNVGGGGDNVSFNADTLPVHGGGKAIVTVSK